MLFSIIVVSLNAGRTLDRTLASIEKQVFTDYEVVVKDGGSTDGSIERLKERLEKNPRVCLVERRDRGIYDAMNQAIESCRGDYYLFLNCGDSFHDEAVLSMMADAIEKEHAVKDAAHIFYGNRYSVIAQTQELSAPVMNDFTCFRNIPCHQVCFYSAGLFAKRGYDLNYVVRADYEHFLWSYYVEHAEFSYVPVCVADYEGGGFSETRQNVKRSAKEHHEITGKYIPWGKRILYRLYLIVTLASLRHAIANNPKTSEFYQRFVALIYHKK